MEIPLRLTRSRRGSESESILSKIGDTPLIRLGEIDRDYPGVSIYAKAEWLNPGGSVKDRAALNMIRAAQSAGSLRPGDTILDATSGNTGIAYAMIGRVIGCDVHLVVPANVSPERKRILEVYGATLTLTDPTAGIDGAIEKAREIAASEPDRYVYLDQYGNENNWRAHYLSTGEEIWQQTAGCVSHFVGALGTSGSFTGVAKKLREYNPDILCVSVQPDEPFHGLEGMKHMDSSIVPGIYDPALADDDIRVNTEDAYRSVRRLVRDEGLFVGISSGAALEGCLEVARRLPANRPAMIVTLFPDSAERYLGERFWDDPRLEPGS